MLIGVLLLGLTVFYGIWRLGTVRQDIAEAPRPAPDPDRPPGNESAEEESGRVDEGTIVKIGHVDSSGPAASNRRGPLGSTVDAQPVGEVISTAAGHQPQRRLRPEQSDRHLMDRPVTAGGDKLMRALIPSAKDQPEIVIEGAGHFLQEDKGEECAAAILTFIRDTTN